MKAGINFALGEIFNHINLTFKIKTSNAIQLNHKPTSINLEVVSFVECLTAMNETIRKNNLTTATIMVLHYNMLQYKLLQQKMVLLYNESYIIYSIVLQLNLVFALMNSLFYYFITKIIIFKFSIFKNSNCLNLIVTNLTKLLLLLQLNCKYL